MAETLDFQFEDMSLEDALAAVAVKRGRSSKWRAVVDAFIASDRDTAAVNVANGEQTPQSMAASISAVLKRAKEDGNELPVMVRARDKLIFLRTDRISPEQTPAAGPRAAKK